MKKLMILLLGLVILFIYPISASADEIDDIIQRYTLVGEELDKFEAQEQANRRKRSVDLMSFDIEKEYQNLISSGELDSNITYEEYYDFITYPEPTDPVISSARNKRSIPSINAGDILITNSTNPGIMGHAGIYLGNNSILSIEGYGAHPSVKTIFQWMVERNSKKDKWTKVYRPKAAYKPAKAANWGNNNIRGKNVDYGFSGATTSLNPTYCSKIVFHSYWYANNNGNGMVLPASLISPYSLPNVFLTYGQADHIATWTMKNIA